MGATCTRCRHRVTWAALDGRSLPFEPTQHDGASFEIYLMHGTYRARPHRGSPNVPAYRRHRCRKDQS